MRFDYSHFTAPTREQLQEVEELVNDLIRADQEVVSRLVSIEEAREAGAMALFGEKYGDEVRMVQMGPSLELCGGTHVPRTGGIGHCRILSEQAIAAGVRRIEAIAGRGADEAVAAWRGQVLGAAGALKCGPEELVERIEKLQAQLKETRSEAEKLKVEVAQSGGQVDLIEQVEEVGGVRLLATEVSVGEPKALRDLGDQLRDRIGSGVLVLAGRREGKAALLVMATKDLAGRVHAGKIMKELAATVGGRGGGRPDMAQGGGPDAERIPDALSRARELVEQQ